MWLTLATYLELPVSSEQSIHAAMLGTMLVTQGFDYLPPWNKNENHDFNSGGLLWIFLEWTLAPSIACLCAWFLFVILKSSILRRENAKKRILVFLPIDYGISAGLLCFVIVSQVIGNYVDVNRLTVMIAVAGSALIGAVLSLVISTFIVYFHIAIVKLCYYPIGFCTQIVVVPLAIKKLAATKNHRNSMENNTSMKQESVQSRINQGCSNGAKVDDDVLEDFMQMRVLETVYGEEERSFGSLDVIQEPEQVQPGDNTSTEQSTPFKQLLKPTPYRLVQTQNFQRIEKTTTIENVIKYIGDTAKSTFSPVCTQGHTPTRSHKLHWFFL
ncbi:phosphate-repressible phosphate permease pho-4 isoform X1 [Gossypium hirsutum]|uniref:Phosphate-repressible phosphate permease pho-4 isoform X1 n=1 Tax=Gossypium hirsutum TaxID=3635 RepID=A0ABM2YYF2_GOSHI|nr:phosphate-repressible phosphate permease pho-4-like isoform X1 [Gossypium hirsutum]